jgi:hypothetical protein
MKFILKFYNKIDPLGWTSSGIITIIRGLPVFRKKCSFWWRDVLKLLLKFNSNINVNVSNGNPFLYASKNRGADTLLLLTMSLFLLRLTPEPRFKWQ